MIQSTGWADARSYISPQSNNAEKYSGTIWLYECEFRFTMHQCIKTVKKQPKGQAPLKIKLDMYRGTISARSPEDGYVLTANKDGKQVCCELNVSSKLTLSELQEYIESRAEALYVKHAAAIERAIHGSVRRESITPALAAHLHVNSYISAIHSGCNEKTKRHYTLVIMKYYSKMPNVPMNDFSYRLMKKFLAENQITDSNKTLLEKFWVFCLDKGFCSGKNPFPVSEKKAKNAKRHQNRSVRSDELSEDVQNKLYELILSDPTGAGCGVALQLWGSIDPKVLAKLKWENIIFDAKDPDYVCVELFDADNAGYTHIRTRPVFPQAARILRARYDMLSSATPGDLSKHPVVSVSNDPQIAMTSDAIVKYSTALLRDCGVQNEVFADLQAPNMAASRTLLKNTYRANLIRKCGLKADSYTVKFLCGDSLTGDVSSDHYISFTDPEALHNLYTLMRVLRPEERLAAATESVLKSNCNGKQEIIVPAFTTTHLASVHLTVRLNPGEELSIECPHGVQGDMYVNEPGKQSK